MSADNAVYIRPMPDGRIAVKLINSLYAEDMSDSDLDKEFADAPQFNTMEDAYNEDERIQDEVANKGGYIEYGTEILKRKDAQPT